MYRFIFYTHITYNNSNVCNVKQCTELYMKWLPKKGLVVGGAISNGPLCADQSDQHGIPGIRVTMAAFDVSSS